MDGLVECMWADPASKWDYQTPTTFFSRDNHHTQTFEHLRDVLEKQVPRETLSPGDMNPLYIEGEQTDLPINSRDLWFKLGSSSIILKDKVFPSFTFSEKGDTYLLDEEVRDGIFWNFQSNVFRIIGKKNVLPVD